MFIFFFLQVFAEQLPIIDIQLGQQYEFEGKVRYQNRVHSPVNYFRFTIRQIEDNQNLIVVLKSITDKNSLPALYMSQTNQQYQLYLPSPSNSDGTICGLEGLNVCTIDPKQLKLQDQYYLGIYCLADCKYYLRIHYEQEQILHLGESTIISGKGERIFKILYPENKDEFDRVIVRTHLVWDAKQYNNGTFYFYVNEGNTNPTPTKHDYKGEEIWTLGKGTVITNKIDNLTVLVISDQKLFFQTLSYPKFRNVSLYEQVDDLVSANSINYYNLIVQTQNQPILNLNTLSIDLNPFDGNPDFFITTGSRPDDINDYKWQTQLDKGFESVAISHRQRQNDSIFYIAIKGHEKVASFNFICYISNYQSRQLTTTSTESGYLEAGEMAQYVIALTQQNQYTIEASYPEETAYIIMKKCSKNATEIKNAKQPLIYIQEASPYNYYNCSVVEEDLIQAQLGQTVLYQGTYIRKEIYSLKFDYSVAECRVNVSSFDFEVYPSNCAYVMAIVNQQLNGNLNYQLTLRDKHQHILILEAQTRSLSLLQYDIAYLVFQINDTAAVEIKFQITVINGEIKIYASQVNKFPDSTNYQIMANMDLDLISFKDSEFNLTLPIYISISSASVLRATITPVVVRNEKLIVKYIKLTDGQQQNIIQSDEEEIHYFSFERNTDEPQPIFFHIRSSLGQFIVYILAVSSIDSEKPSPEHNHYVLQSQDHTLILQNGDENYLSKGTYKLAVLQQTFGNSSYTIWISSQNQINQLKYGHPQASTIDDQQSNFFYFLLNYNLTEVFVIRTLKIEESFNNSIQIFVSKTYKFPNRNQYDFRLDRSYISIKDIIVGDTIYIGVFSSGYNDYTLLIRGVQAITEILENQLQYMPMPSYSEYRQADIYFRLQNFDQSVQVQASTKFAEISLFSKVMDYSTAKQKIQNNDRSIFPSESNFMVRNRETGTSSNKLLILLPQQMQQCQSFKTGCMMLITVKLNAESLYSMLFGNHDDISNVSNNQGEDGFFTILVSQSTLTLKNGDVSIGFSLAKMFSYYKFEVPYPIDIVELTVIPIGDGDPDIYVSKQNTSTDVYPNLEYFDFHSNQYKQDTLLLMQESFQNRDNSGVYIAGITGFQEDVTFRISLDWADIQFNTLLVGQVFKKSISQGVYFRYEHSKKKSFRIIVQGMQHINLQISTLSGAYTLSSKTSFLKQLPFYSNTSDIKYQIDRNDDLFGGILQIDQNSTQFCYRCTYLIGIQCISQGDLKLMVAINSKPLDLELGVQLLDYATEEGNIYFANASNTKSYIEIILHSGDYQLRTTTDILTKSSDEKVYNSTSRLVISFNDILYLLLKPTVEAKYQISFQRDSHVIQLIIGKPYKSDQVGEYEFTFDPIRHQELYNLQLICSNCTQNLYANNKKISKYLLVDPKESHLFEQQQDYRYQLSYNYSYKIAFSSNTSFEIILSLDGVKYLGTDQKLQEILGSNKSIRYDVYGKTGQQLQISVINCIGKVHINSNQLNSTQQYFYEYDEDLFFDISANETLLYNKSQRLSVYNLIINEAPYIWQQIDIQQNITIVDTKAVFNISQVKLNTDLPIDAMIYVLHISNFKEAVVAFAGCNFDSKTLKNYDLANESMIHIKKIILKPDVSQDWLVFEILDLPKVENLYFYVIQSVYIQDRKAPVQYHFPIFEYQQILEDPDEQEEEESVQKPLPEESTFQLFLKNYLIFITIGIGFTSILAIGFIIRFFLRRVKKVSNPGYNDEEVQDINELPKPQTEQADIKQQV